MEDSKIIKVETEDGVVRDAQLLTIFEVIDTGKEYAIYSIPGPNDTQNIFGGLVIKDASGNDQLIDLETEEERQMIRDMIESIPEEA